MAESNGLRCPLSGGCERRRPEGASARETTTAGLVRIDRLQDCCCGARGRDDDVNCDDPWRFRRFADTR